MIYMIITAWVSILNSQFKKTTNIENYDRVYTLFGLTVLGLTMGQFWQILL